jgi:AcrR family transcriptional regulator
MSSATTKDRILDAAEHLFAVQGYDATSLRAVTGEADVNLAAVHYHFGGKLQLFQAVCERRVGHINRERIRLLGEVEKEAGAGGPSLEALLEALFAPTVRLFDARGEGHARFAQLMGRVHSSASEHGVALKGVFQEVRDRFVPALLRVLPHLRPPDLMWRMHFLIGAMCTHLADPNRIYVSSDGQCAADDPEESLRQLVAFAAGALRAPAVHP